MKKILTEPFVLFKIENFLDDETYISLNESFDFVDFDKLRDDADGKFSVDSDSIEFQKFFKNKRNKVFFEKIQSKKFQNFFFFKFFFYYMFNKPKFFFNKILPNFFFKKINTKIQYSYILNKGLVHPHIDGAKKLISLMLYFPQLQNKEEEIGTSFWKCKHNFNSARVNVDEFKSYQKIQLPFKKKTLYGFIRSPFSWHAVEKLDIEEKYIRRSININFNIN